VTWHYQPPWFPAGLVLSLAAAAFILFLLAACAAYTRRPRRPARRPAAVARQREPAAAGQGGRMAGTDT
jgi:hypothetical protein